MISYFCIANGQFELFSSGIDFLKGGVTSAGELAKGLGGHVVDSAVLVQNSGLDMIGNAVSRADTLRPSARPPIIQGIPPPSPQVAVKL